MDDEQVLTGEIGNEIELRNKDEVCEVEEVIKFSSHVFSSFLFSISPILSSTVFKFNCLLLDRDDFGVMIFGSLRFLEKALENEEEEEEEEEKEEEEEEEEGFFFPPRSKDTSLDFDDDEGNSGAAIDILRKDRPD
jgi:hypothetical protein